MPLFHVDLWYYIKQCASKTQINIETGQSERRVWCHDVIRQRKSMKKQVENPGHYVGLLKFVERYGFI